MARRFQTRLIRIHSISMMSPSSETSTTRARSLQKHLATQSARLACLLGKSTRASSIELTDRRPSRLRGHREQIDLTEGGLVVTPDENNRRAEALKLLAQAPENGKNNFLITHKPNIVDALGKDGPTSRRVRPRSSCLRAANIGSRAGCQWRTGRNSPSPRIKHRPDRRLD